MFETVENFVQVSILAVCVIISYYQYKKTQDKQWTHLFFFYGGFLAGDIYWLIYLFNNEESDQLSFMSNLSWYIGFIFLCLLVYKEVKETEWREKLADSLFIPLPYIGPIFTTIMAVVFMQYGQYMSNYIYAVILGILMFFAITGLMVSNESDNPRGHRSVIPTKKASNGRLFYLCKIALFLCIFDYGSWISSCFETTSFIYLGYYLFDILMTLTFPFFIVALKKEEPYKDLFEKKF